MFQGTLFDDCQDRGGIPYNFSPHAPSNDWDILNAIFVNSRLRPNVSQSNFTYAKKIYISEAL